MKEIDFTENALGPPKYGRYGSESEISRLGSNESYLNYRTMNENTEENISNDIEHYNIEIIINDDENIIEENQSNSNICKIITYILISAIIIIFIILSCIYLF